MKKSRISNLIKTNSMLIMFMLLTMAFVGGVAYAYGNGDVIHACVKDNGQVRIVDGPDDCKNSEMALEWNIVGPAGPQGEVGLQGLQGDVGPEGADGEDGAPGADGVDGAQGPKGDTGDTGSTGPQGEVGPEGPIGPIGPQGEPGPQGEQGPAGLSGDVTIEQYCDLELRIKDALPSFPLTSICEPPSSRIAIESIGISVLQFKIHITGTGEPLTTVGLFLGESCELDFSDYAYGITGNLAIVNDEYLVPNDGIIDWWVDLDLSIALTQFVTNVSTWTIGEIDTIESVCSAPYEMNP